MLWHWYASSKSLISSLHLRVILIDRSSLATCFLKYLFKIALIFVLECFNWSLKSWFEILQSDMCWERRKLIFMSLSFKSEICLMLIYWLLIILETTSRKLTWITSFKLWYFHHLEMKFSMRNVDCMTWLLRIWFTKIVSRSENELIQSFDSS